MFEGEVMQMVLAPGSHVPATKPTPFVYNNDRGCARMELLEGPIREKSPHHCHIAHVR